MLWPIFSFHGSFYVPINKRLVPEFKAFWTALQRWFHALSQQLQSFCLISQGAQPFDPCAGGRGAPVKSPSTHSARWKWPHHLLSDREASDLDMSQEYLNPPKHGIGKKTRTEKPAHLFSPASALQWALQNLRHCGLPCDIISQSRAQSHLQHIGDNWRPQKSQHVLSTAPAQEKNAPCSHLPQPSSSA